MDYLYQLLEMLHIKKVNNSNIEFQKPSGYKNINTNSIKI